MGIEAFRAAAEECRHWFTARCSDTNQGGDLIAQSEEELAHWCRQLKALAPAAVRALHAEHPATARLAVAFLAEIQERDFSAERAMNVMQDWRSLEEGLIYAQSLTPTPTYPDPENHTRDKWLYELDQSGVNIADITKKLQDRAEKRRDFNSASETAVRAAIRTYANHYGLPIAQRKRGRPVTKKKSAK